MLADWLAHNHFHHSKSGPLPKDGHPWHRMRRELRGSLHDSHLSSTKGGAKWAGFRIWFIFPPEHLPGEVFRGSLTLWRPQGKHGTCRRSSCFGWLGNTSGLVCRSWTKWLGWERSRHLCFWVLLPHNPALDEEKKMDGWHSVLKWVACSG